MYKPQPIDTSKIKLPNNLEELREFLAENAHEIWARQRIKDGWTYGPERDDKKKRHPDLIPYDQLPDAEKEYDRQMAMETLKVILAMGYKIEKA